MNEYIINPSWFYWISVCDGVKVFCYIIGFVCGMVGGGNIISHFVNMGFDDNVAELNKKWAIRLGVATIIVVLIGTLIPSKETLIQMKLAELITYDNAEKIIENIQDATNYILENISGK